MDKYIDKAEVLLEALPYFKAFNDKTIVIKYGGSAMIDDKIQGAVLRDIVMMKYIGLKPIIVHGGGKEISGLLEKVGKEAKFIHGYRVTDQETMEIAEMVLSGKVGKNIVRHIQIHGVNAVGISGKDAGLLQCEKKKVEQEDIGLVGEVKKVNPMLIKTLIADGFIPVISPIGMDEEGNTYNINADHAACAIAGALDAEKLVFMTDVPGVLGDPEDLSTLINELKVDKIDGMIKTGEIKGGMIPKLLCCKKAIEDGVKQVHVLNGCLSHSLLMEIFTNKGIGTMVVPESSGEEE